MGDGNQADFRVRVRSLNLILGKEKLLRDF